MEEPDKFITFEDQIMLDHTSFIDGFIPSTHVLIEQKSLGKELNKPIKLCDLEKEYYLRDIPASGVRKALVELFLDGLRAELEELKEIAVDKTRRARLGAFQSKLAGLTFLDPACGSGNFLTETYLSLRKLENEVLRCSTDQISMDLDGIIQVSIGQFYGIEINDFAVTVAKTALWIAESQMMKETESVVPRLWKFLNVYINYAHRTFVWDSEAKQKAHVHCVIIGFAAFERKVKLLYQDGRAKQATNINAYLCDAPNVIVDSQSKPLCDVSPMVYGNKPADGGNLIIEDAD